MHGGPPEPSNLLGIPPAGLDARLQGMTDKDFLLGVVRVRKGGRTIFEKVYGMPDRDADVLNRPLKQRLWTLSRLLPMLPVVPHRRKN
jgi:hypothetical protein